MTEPMKALIVDDEEKIRSFIRETLERSGHTVFSAGSGEEALEILQETAFDLAVLDLKLSGFVDGQRVLEAIRWRWPSTVVIMLTAHGSLESALDAIKENVDSYLLKPVRPSELRKAIEEAVYHRRQLIDHEQDTGKVEVIESGPFRIDLARHLATRSGKPLELSDREFRLLVHLIENAPEVIDPKHLVRIVRQYEPEHQHEAREIIKWYIHRLRKKAEPDPGNPRHIINVHGVGYRFSD